MSTSVSAIKGITIVQPVIGRIMMGHTEVRAGGKCVPQKDDHFTITTLVQKDDRSWEKHPINDVLQPPAPQNKVRGAAAQAAAASQTAQQKLTSIPVRIAYNNPSLNLHSSYSSFDSKTGRVLCTSDGETAKRATSEGIATMACPRPEACEFGHRPPPLQFNRQPPSRWSSPPPPCRLNSPARQCSRATIVAGVVRRKL